MGDCCNCSSEVSRDGSGQLSRYLKALDPSYALIDDRSIEELLVFTKRYANQVRFYDIPESVIPGDEDKTKISWSEFFRRDIAVIAASISQTDIWQIKKDYEELRAKLDAHPTHGLFGDLFDPILGMVVKIDGWYTLAIPENPLYADLQLAINSNLKAQAQKIIAYEEGFKYVDSKHPLNLDYSAIKNRNIWGLDDTINADISIYQGTDTEEKISNAALYVDDVFNSFYGFISQLITNSESYMQFALEQYPAHQPHMALFIAFLQLFRLAQDQVNGITQRMLDYYYRDVLHLTAKPSIPDKVHIVFELAKDVAEYDLVPGTALKAGKDASGKDQIYITETDLVVNQAKVKEIKNIFIQKQPVQITGTDGKPLTEQLIQNIYARPVANSQDGLGEKFTDPTNTKWRTFGQSNAALNASNNICDQIIAGDDTDRKDQAQIGFAIASPQLVLQGGNRLISLQINDLNKLLNNNQTDFEILLSAEKEWLKIDNNWLLKNNKSDEFKSFINDVNTNEIFNLPADLADLDNAYLKDNDTLYIYLPIVAPAIIPFNNKLHQGFFYNTPYPVLQIMIGPGIDINYSDFDPINDISMSVRVGSINQYSTDPITVTGSVQDTDGKPLGGVNIRESSNKSTSTTNADGSFTIDTSKSATIAFVNTGFEPQAIAVNGRSVINVVMSTTTGTSMPTLPSYFDGLKVLKLKNALGEIDPSKPFDPFTTFPTQGSAFYIGSDEIFNKPLGELTINITHVMDSFDKLDIGSYDVSQNAAALKSNDAFSFGIYKVSVFNKKQWQKLCTPRGTDFLEGSLTQNILFTDDDGIQPYSVDRIPLSYANLDESTNSRFIRIENQLPIIQDDSFSTNTTNDAAVTANKTNTDVFQLMARVALIFKIKEISLSYYSLLQPLDSATDQFFHIYPFGIVETYLKITDKNGVTVPAKDFTTLDAEKGYLLVDAKNALLPQFDYISPYAKYYSDKTDATAATSSTAVRLLTDEKDSVTNITNQYTGDIQEGTLYIGLEKLQPLQSISMLFQFAEGSAEDEDDDPPTINWSYLSYNEWKPMRAESIVSDGTYGFQTTGIIRIDVPEDASTHNTVITDGLLWLSASVTDNANRIPQLIDIVTQAAEAVFQDQNNDQSHFDVALSAGSISKLSVPVAQVSKVQQPFASFDGKHQEVGKEFYTRVSERLRHKQRAITAWDYEHLVLDRFPSIYKVKCITHTDPNCLCRNILTGSGGDVFPARIIFDGNNALNNATANKVGEFLNANPSINITLVGYGGNGLNYVNEVTDIFMGKLSLGSPIIHPPSPERINYKLYPKIVTDPVSGAEVVDIIQTETCCGPQIAPGHVLLVPIANLKNRNAANPLQPKTSRRTLIAIQEYLKTLTSPFVHVYAKNPVYEQIIVAFKVQFYAGNDKGYYMKKLNEEIVHYLTPWAFDENAEVSFNQKIYASSIINFIEERTYVDFITDFTMGVCCNDCCPPSMGVGVTDLNVNVYDSNKDDVKKLIGDIPVKIKELDRTVNSEKDVPTVITAIPAGTFTVLAYFSLFEIQSQTFTVNADRTITQVIDGVTTTISTIDFYRTTGNEQTDVANFFSHICDCTEIEWFLKSDPDFEGDIVAKPCTPRSILVSVPQHIIVPYISPVEPSDCDSTISNAMNTFRLRTGIMPARIKTAVPLKSLPEKMVAKKTTDKLMAKKKAVEAVPAKTKATSDVKKIKATPKPSAKHKKTK